MFIYGLLIFPFGYLMQAYKEACFEVPIQGEYRDRSVERIYKSDPRYNEALENIQNSHIKEQMQPFLKKCGVRKDLIFLEAPSLSLCTAIGTNMFQKGDATILVSKGFHQTDEEACTWTLKHEISHIKHNDKLTIFAVPAVCQLSAAIFGIRSLSYGYS
ncbi:MAG: hypothetical protein AAGI90_02200 [Chlamydiota bacterium]